MTSSEAAGAPGLLDTLQQAAGALAAIPVADRAGEACERIEALHRLRARLDAQLLSELATFEIRGGHQAAGAKTVGSWVRLHLRQAHPETALSTATAQLPLDPWPKAPARNWDNPRRPARPIPDLDRPTGTDPDPPRRE